MKREDINNLAQLVELEKLEKFYKNIEVEFDIEILSPATEQTLLIPVIDPVSNSEFYAGEILVTSTIVQIKQTKGWSMVMDSNKELSLYTAILDACFEANIKKDEIRELLNCALEVYKEKNKNNNQKINSTKVSFDLM